MSRFRAVLAFTAVAATLALALGQADARPGSGGSFGSRGMRTFAPPPVTRTAPTPAAPVQRTITQPNRPTPGVTQPAPVSRPGFFNRPGFFPGLLTGLLGAGLLGLLFGNGMLGGLSGFASILGLLLQIGLIVVVGRLIWNWWQRRQSYATAGGPPLRDAPPVQNYSSYGRDNLGGGGGSPSGQPDLTKADFDTFEHRLSDVTQAYGAGDLGRLRTLATPEMVGYFQDDLAGYARRGLTNEVSDIKLLQGDLAEAWREGDTDYATLAMRYGLRDAMVDHNGNVVEGSREPQEVTELWTFQRPRGDDWKLSAIQQAG
jgi:predicted lipid-binding transport protein (Tim44 family)